MLMSCNLLLQTRKARGRKAKPNFEPEPDPLPPVKEEPEEDIEASPLQEPAHKSTETANTANKTAAIPAYVSVEAASPEHADTAAIDDNTPDLAEAKAEQATGNAPRSALKILQEEKDSQQTDDGARQQESVLHSPQKQQLYMAKALNSGSKGRAVDKQGPGRYSSRIGPTIKLPPTLLDLRMSRREYCTSFQI